MAWRFWLPQGCAALLLVAHSSAQTPRLGRVSFAASGKPAAQGPFLTGVGWLYNFGYEEARESFQQAQKIDPDFVMAYWGEALTHYHPVWHTENLPAARRVLARLGPTPEARAARAATPREKAYLAAIERLFGDGDKDRRDAAYAAAMERLMRDFPDDRDAACLYALALMNTVPLGVHEDPRLLAAGAIADAVFAQNPMHPAAAHIILHAYDNRDHAPRALEAARAYAKFAAESSHALHMPAHIFFQLGMWKDASDSDEAAFAASDTWVRRRRQPLAMRDYHSLSWLSYEYLQQGRFREARAAWQPLEAAVKESAAGDSHGSPHKRGPTDHDGEPMGTPDTLSLRNDLASMRAYYVVESRRWDEMKGQGNFDNVEELFALGLSASRLGDVPRAAAALELLQKFVVTDTDEDRKPIALIMTKELEGVLPLAAGRVDAALVALREATAIERRLRRPVARPHPIKPSNELLGEVLLELGRPADAVPEFEQTLWRVANRSASVLGLARAAARLGDRAAAERRYRQFLENWQRADPELAELAEARRYLESSPRLDR